MPRDTIITARLSRDVAERLRGAAVATRRSVSAIVADLVTAAFTRPPAKQPR